MKKTYELKIINIIVGITFTILFLGCFEKTSDTPQKVYKYWAGSSPPSDIKVINGQYWQSAHFTKEYIMYLQIEAPIVWSEEFIEQNKLIKDTTSWKPDNETPLWFTPTKEYEVWQIDDEFQDSRYFVNKNTGSVFIYEIQL